MFGKEYRIIEVVNNANCTLSLAFRSIEAAKEYLELLVNVSDRFTWFIACETIEEHRDRDNIIIERIIRTSRAEDHYYIMKNNKIVECPFKNEV